MTEINKGGSELDDAYDRLAMLLGMTLDDLKSALARRTKPNLDWRIFALYGSAIVVGLVIIWLSTHIFSGITIPDDVPPELLSRLALARFLEHLGVAFVIAAAVAGLFHFAHERKVFGQPVEEMSVKLRVLEGRIDALGNELEQRTDEWSETLRGKTNELADTVSGFSNVMRFAKERGIKDAFSPSTEDWERAILSVIKNSEDHLYVAGRSLRPFLVQDAASNKSGWLGKAIKERISHKPPTDVAFLLADVFDERSEYREELKLLFLDAPNSEAEKQGCRDSVDWILTVMNKYSSDQCAVSLRLLQTRPSLFLVMSDREAVVGHYLPFKELKCVRMVRVESGSDLYADYRDHFLTYFALGSEPALGIEKFLFQHHGDRGVTSRWEEVLARIGESSCTHGRLVNTVAQRQHEFQVRGLRASSLPASSTISDPSIVRAFKRGDHSFIQAVRNAVEAEASFIYIIGRCHASMLGEGVTDTTGEPAVAWLRGTLTRVLKKTSPQVTVKVILPNTFTADHTEYDEEVNAISEHSPGELGKKSKIDIKHLTRRTVDELLEMKIRSGGPEEAFVIKLVHRAPRLCMVMTSNVCFVELYVPGQDGGVNEISEIQKSREADGIDSRSYQSYRDYFEYLLNSEAASDAVDAVQEYCERRRSDYSLERALRLERYRKAYPGGSAENPTIKGQQTRDGTE